MTHKCKCGHHEANDSQGSGLTALLIGGLIGAGIAIYLSSGNGKKQLGGLKGKLMQYQGDFENKLGEFKREKVDGFVDRLKDELGDISDEPEDIG
jgi:hypothetical protein